MSNQAQWLRSELRQGTLTPDQRPAFIAELYRLERAAEGLPNPMLSICGACRGTGVYVNIRCTLCGGRGAP